MRGGVIIDKQIWWLRRHWGISKGDDVQFGVCYKATIHGDNAKDFIDNCGGISPLLFIIETTNGYRFGAFTTLPLNGANEYNMDENAFLFSFDTGKKYGECRGLEASYC